MPRGTFIVQADSGKLNEGFFRVTKTTRKDALETAQSLLAQKIEGVTITDEAGRVYKPSEFGEFGDEDE